MHSSKLPLLLAALLTGIGGNALAADAGPTAGVSTKADKTVKAPFDIVQTRISTKGNVAIFQMAVSGKAGASRPAKSGKLAGSSVFSYVWPTTLDPSVVGFEPKAGILAFAVTAHPDFDDTPLFDEDGDGDPNNDGKNWHSHWVVLAKDEACGPGGLKVRDISPGEDIAMPATAPGLPLMLDSPGYSPLIRGADIAVNSAVGGPNQAAGAGFDAVTARLRVHKETKAPLLCVVEAMDVASGKLDLSGRIVEEK